MPLPSASSQSNQSNAAFTPAAGAAPSVTLPMIQQILATFSASGWFNAVRDALAAPGKKDVIVPGLANGSLKAFLALALAEAQQKPLIVIASDPPSANRWQGVLEQCLSNGNTLGNTVYKAAALGAMPVKNPKNTPDALASVSVFRYPDEGFSPYDLAVMPPPVLSAHLNFLQAAANNTPGIYIISARQLLFKHPTFKHLQSRSIKLQLGQLLDNAIYPTCPELDPLDALVQRLKAMGYLSSQLVHQPGEFSRRGDILDVYPTLGAPFRAVFFGEQLESLRLIDAESQRSLATADSVTILPKSNLILDTPEQRETLITNLNACLNAHLPQLEPIAGDALRVTIEGYLQLLQQTDRVLPEAMDYLAPLCYARKSNTLTNADALGALPEKNNVFASLSSQLPANACVILEDWAMTLNHLEGVQDKLDNQLKDGTRHGHLLEMGQSHHVSLQAALGTLRQHAPKWLLVEPLGLPDSTAYKMTGATGHAEDFAQSATVLPLAYQAPERFQADLPKAVAYMAAYRKAGAQVLVSTDYPQRVLDACREADLPAVYGENAFSPGDILISRQGPPEGFLLTGDTLSSPSGLGVSHSALTGDEFLTGNTLTSLSSGALLSETSAAPSPEKQTGLDSGLRGHDDVKKSLTGVQLLYITDGELFSHRRLQRSITQAARKKRDAEEEALQNVDELRPGDYVVHAKHGIGQFVTLTQMKLDGETREYLTLEYAKGDRLHVPVDQVNLLTRYRGAGDAPPKLNKMGGAEWSNAKRKVKSSIESIAKELVALYAKRAQVPGYAFDPDSPWQIELEEAFPYTETPDQWQAITDVKKDMEQQKPMDRLICGDVGFGKTEVAIRGIFKAILSGKQAAVLVPTTILAQQHYQTLAERFAPYSVRVGLLSRFRTAAEQRETVQRLQKGELDVVVGTHRLLQKDIQFKDLGLLVIDEEHRFGVAHKEKIKHLRAHVDVLTLSATPIPRTLYMSLSGVREMSLINTPPTNRAPVQTYVGPYNPAQVRMAILHELDRGGQVYFLHNRVQTIHETARHLEGLVPEARIIVAHGQMNETQLENAMLDFAQHQADILLCTTIIESGVDIPNANTMIIDQCDRFGLAQLYQIRGRVGRSDRQAYAFLYYAPEKILTEDANNRLRAIREYTALGSGYQIAQRDMEIRGVGNILGADQHGHMVAIGFDLYCQMLQDCIERIQSGLEPDLENAAAPGERMKIRGDAPSPKGLESVSPDKAESAIIDINVTALIPEKWVGSRDIKLTEYKRLAAIYTERALDAVRAEWQDRFGDIPPEAAQLLNLVKLRIWATELKFPQVRTDGEFLRISVPYNLTEWMQRQAKMDGKLANKLRWVAGVSSQAGSTPTLQMRLGVMDGDEIVTFLLKLFAGLRKG
ncbi:MAG: transcription-repair coupling factor [Vampirovibrionales bacterium]|nr:transcription-repair coupling factor [Vampirovibrionales bacterium]